MNAALDAIATHADRPARRRLLDLLVDRARVYLASDPQERERIDGARFVAVPDMITALEAVLADGVDVECRHCGASIPPDRQDRRRFYCGRSCQLAASRRRRSERRAA